MGCKGGELDLKPPSANPTCTWCTLLSTDVALAADSWRHNHIKYAGMPNAPAIDGQQRRW